MAIRGAQDNEAKRGAATLEQAEIDDYLKDFAAKSQTRGLNEKTIAARVSVLSLLHRRGADLFNPESVFRAIDHAKKFNRKTGDLLDEEWSDEAKNNASQAYMAFCAGRISIPDGMNFKKWQRNAQKLPWIPLEREVDELIAGCNRRFGAFLQLLKETGARPGEAWQLKWTDIDTERSIVTINNPEKGSNPRQHKLSAQCIAMLNMLPKSSERVFGGGQLKYFRTSFTMQRKRLAHKIQNPRINMITFRTLRHFYGTMEYFKTKDLLHVQQKLGHKSITNTMVYTHLVNFEGDEFHTATAKTLQEFEDLLKAGFEFVADMDGVMVCRKRK